MATNLWIWELPESKQNIQIRQVEALCEFIKKAFETPVGGRRGGRQVFSLLPKHPEQLLEKESFFPVSLSHGNKNQCTWVELQKMRSEVCFPFHKSEALLTVEGVCGCCCFCSCRGVEVLDLTKLSIRELLHCSSGPVPYPRLYQSRTRTLHAVVILIPGYPQTTRLDFMGQEGRLLCFPNLFCFST